MIDNLLTKSCVIKKIASKNSVDGFISVADEIEEIGTTVKCSNYGNFNLQRSYSSQELANYDLNLIIKGNVDIDINFKVEFENQNYKVESIKEYIPYANNIIKPYKVLNLTRLLK